MGEEYCDGRRRWEVSKGEKSQTVGGIEDVQNGVWEMELKEYEGKRAIRENDWHLSWSRPRSEAVKQKDVLNCGSKIHVSEMVLRYVSPPARPPAVSVSHGVSAADFSNRSPLLLMQFIWRRGSWAVTLQPCLGLGCAPGGTNEFYIKKARNVISGYGKTGNLFLLWFHTSRASSDKNSCKMPVLYTYTSYLSLLKSHGSAGNDPDFPRSVYRPRLSDKPDTGYS
jgi:hypothetical protein